jgi:hypothetical protein
MIATAAMAVVLLAMSVGETSFKGQYLIDQGEYLSLVGLAFILVAGLYLHRHRRLVASLPLVFPWLLYPVITQGDQIIDNLSITWMRVIVHVLLAAIFAMPVAVIVYAARWLWTITPQASKRLTLTLLLLELGLSYAYLGWLMHGTLVAMIALVALWPDRRADDAGRLRANAALATLLIGVAASGALYLGFKNRPGAYQGSPSFYMDPSQPGGAYRLSAVAVPDGEVSAPAQADEIKQTLQLYASSLQKLLDGYYVLDRNYNYHFHNELFMRSDPLLPDYRRAGLAMIAEGAAMRRQADENASGLIAQLGQSDASRALIEDLRGYVAFSFERAATLEQMSAGFETTKAGLQHATHIYEGEGKYLGVQLDALLEKHARLLTAPAVQPAVAEFVVASRLIYEKYSNRIVGF